MVDELLILKPQEISRRRLGGSSKITTINLGVKKAAAKIMSFGPTARMRRDFVCL
jgi:hypothetical protein